MPRRLLLVPLALVGVVALAACGSDSDGERGDTSDTSPSSTAEDAAGELDGTTYESTSIEGRQLVDGSTVLLTFEDGTLSVVAGCNTISGSYSSEGGTLTFEGEPRMTMMGCDQALADQDTWLAEWFTAGVTVTETDGGLQLEGDGVTMDLVAGGDEVDAPLVGVTWTLETISTDATSSNVPASVTAPTIEFAEDGTVALTLGCNTGNSSVTTSGDTMTFSPVASTRMACEDDAMAVEATVTSVLDGDVTFAIEGDRLTLTKGTSSLIYAGA